MTNSIIAVRSNRVSKYMKETFSMKEVEYVRLNDDNAACS